MFSNSLRGRLLLPLVAVILVVVAAIAIALADHEAQRIRNTATTSITEHSRNLQSLFSVTRSIMLDRLQGSMRLLRQRGEALGPASSGTRVELENGAPRDANDLLFGGKPQANRFSLVDDVRAVVGGTATLFSKTDDDFVRISTNVYMDNGARALGTILDPKGPAIAEIRKGSPYYGVVDILGKPFVAGYEPILDAKGEVVGVWYVGYPADMQSLNDAISNSRVLKQGFVALFDGKNTLRFHSSSQSNEDLIQGFLKGTPEGWVAIREDVPGWGFTLISAYPKAEIENAILFQSSWIIGGGILVAALLMGMLSSLIVSRVIRPIHSLTVVADEISRGKTGRKIEEANAEDEIGILAKAISRLSNTVSLAMTRVAAQRQGA